MPCPSGWNPGGYKLSGCITNAPILEQHRCSLFYELACHKSEREEQGIEERRGEGVVKFWAYMDLAHGIHCPCLSLVLLLLTL